MTLKKMNILFAFIACFSLLTSCGDEEPSTESKGTLKLEITDAPIDDANVKGTFVTITDIKVDGNSIEGFNTTTLDLMAYQNGDTKLLSNANLDAKSYSELTLVLDFDKDANGDAPGCYVLEESNNTKHKLITASNEIKINNTFEVEKESQSNLVIDFDLRKCIKREENGGDGYDFVTKSEMEGGIRIVNNNSVGVIKGNCSDSFSDSDKVVVYAYKKGDFNREAEVQGQGQSNVEFSSAVTSSTLDANGNFELHFLEEGEYEIHYCSYKENSTGKMELKGTLTLSVIGSLNLNAINVDASGSVTINTLVTGILLI